MMVNINGKVKWLEEHKTHPEFGPLIRSLVFQIGRSSTDWIEDFEVCSSPQKNRYHSSGFAIGTGGCCLAPRGDLKPSTR